MRKGPIEQSRPNPDRNSRRGHPPAAVPHLARRFTCCGRDTLRHVRRMPSPDALQPTVLLRLDMGPLRHGCGLRLPEAGGQPVRLVAVH